MQSDGSGAHPVSAPPRAGEWGRANLPFGDYDPRISPDGASLVFERLVDDRSPHGNYDFFKLDLASSNETRLTHTGYAQGLASWSSDGQRILYVVAAIEEAGKYDLYVMNADGTDNQDVTPGYFPDLFLCHGAVFGQNATSIYFVGEWWE
jgi:Tol biopolymer transport system component